MPSKSAPTFFNWQGTADTRMLSIDMIIITIGIDEPKENFKVHRDIITKNNRLFIRVCKVKVGSSSRYVFEEHPNVFVGLLQWAYYGKLFVKPIINNVDNLWKLYCYAENHKIIHLHDVLMNRIMKFYKSPPWACFPNYNQIQTVYKNISKSSGGRIFMAMCYLYISNTKDHNTGMQTTYDDAQLADAIQTTGGLREEILEITSQGLPLVLDWDPRGGNPCIFHHHGWLDRSKCPKYHENA